MSVSKILINPRFCETDASGFINSTSHLMYFEEARSNYFEEIYPNRPSDFSFILVNVECRYLNQIPYKQSLEVKTYVKKIGTKSFTITQELYLAGKEVLMASADIVIVSFLKSLQKSISHPSELRAKLEEITHVRS